MLTSALVLALGCSPNLLGMLQDREVPGPGVTLRQTFKNPGVSLSLVDGAGTVRWVDAKASPIDGPTAFSADGRLVALKGGLGEVTLYDAAGKRHEVKVMPLVTSDESDFIPTRCGFDWLDGLRFDGATLVVSIRQRTWPVEGSSDVLPRRAAGGPGDEAGDAAGARRTGDGGLIAAWSAEPGRRVDLAGRLWVKAKHRRTDKVLAAFLREQVTQVKEQPLLGLLQGALRELSPAKR